MSVRVEGVGVNAPPGEVVRLLLDVDKVMERAPRSVVRRWDPRERRADIGLWRRLSGFREIFNLEARREGDGVVYTFTSARIMHAFETYRIVIRFQVTGSGLRSRLNAQLEGEGFNVAGFRATLEKALREWLTALKSYIEEEYAKSAVKPRAAPRKAVSGAAGGATSQAAVAGVAKTREETTATRAAVSQVQPRPVTPPPQQDPLLEGSRRLRDPLFEAEILLRGELVYTGTVVASKIVDIIDTLRGIVEGELSGTYVIKATVGAKEFNLLIENGKLVGAVASGEKEALGLDAVKELQALLPAEVFVTAMRL